MMAGRLRAQAEKRQGGFGEHREGHRQADLHDQRRDRIGQDMDAHDARVAAPMQRAEST